MEKYILKKILPLFLIVVVVLSGTLYINQEEAEAQIIANIGACAAEVLIGNILAGVFNDIIGGIFADEVPVADRDVRVGTGSLVRKEYFLDCFVWAFQEEMIDRITERGITFIQGGNFGATPFFVEDPTRFFTDLEDQVAESFIDETFALSMLGNPFRPTVERALTSTRGVGTRIAFEDQSQFTLDAVSPDPRAFLEGDFSQGGFEAYEDYLSNPAGNIPIIGYLAANEEIVRRQSRVEGEYKDLLDQGDGFLPELEGSSIVTPGVVLQQQTQELITTGLNELLAADEISEVIGVLLSNIISSIFSQGNDLLNL